MPTQINYCKVDDCETRCHGKGYCLMHYKRVMKHGTTDKFVAPLKIRLCGVEDCGTRHDSLGYCIRHLRQFQKYGRILTLEEMYKHRSEAKIGTTHKGAVWSEEAKMVQSKKRKGIRNNTGRTHFEKGFTPWNKGIQLSQEIRDKISRATRKYTDEEKTANKVLRGRTKRLRELVFARDNDICQVCFSASEYMQVDHIKRWSEYPELRFELENLRTVCMPCHYYITYKRKLPEGVFWGHRRTQ